SFLFLLMRDVKLWNRRFHLIGLKRVVGKRTCDGSGGPLPVQLAPAFGGDRQNQAKFGGQVLKNSAIAPRQRSRLVLDGVVPAVHCSHTNRAVGSAQDEVLPQLRLTSGGRQRVGRASGGAGHGNPFGTVDDELGTPRSVPQIDVT